MGLGMRLDSESGELTYAAGAARAVVAFAGTAVAGAGRHGC